METTFENNIKRVCLIVIQIYVLKVFGLLVTLLYIIGKIKNCQLKLKFVTLTNSNIQNSIMMFTYSVSG